jgi:hypothetical protein
MKKRIVAPCGIDCFNCELYEDNVTEEIQARISAATRIPIEKISCLGCSNGNSCLLLRFQNKQCETLQCVNEKKVSFCFECNDFPCKLLMPIADEAKKYPHNIKLYNLCTIKRIGIDAWAEQVKSIRQTYFHHTFSIGKGGKE